jgi:lysophospholipase L1-like esterase
VRARLGAFLLGTAAALAALELGLAVFSTAYARLHAPRPSADDGRTTVLCVGDSFTFGTGAPRGRSYPEQLEALLNAGGPKYRVVNAGKGAANTAIVRTIFEDQVERVRPRVVALMFGPPNDWNLTGYRRPGQSALAAAVMDACRNIRIVKLAKLVRHQWTHTAQPGFRPDAPASTREDSVTERVIGLLLKEQPQAARRVVEESLRGRPDDGRLHALKGFVSFEARDWDRARADFQKALTLSPGDEYARVGLMGLELRSRPGPDAGQRAAKLVSSLSDDATLKIVARFMTEGDGSGQAALEEMLRSGEPPENILRAAQRLRRERPWDPRVPFAMGKAELLRERPREAEEFFQSAQALAPDDARLTFDIALSYLYTPFSLMARPWALRGRRLAPEAPDFALLMLHSYELPGLTAAQRAEARGWALEVKEHLNRGRRLLYWRELLDQPAAVALGDAARFFEDASGATDIDAWIRADLSAIAAECRRRGIRLIVMNYPRPVRFRGYKESAVKEGAEFVDNEAVFDRLRRDGSAAAYFAPDGHCNAAGYGLIARALADKILSAPLIVN